MSIRSFASIVGGKCGPNAETDAESTELVKLKDCNRDVIAHLKLCNVKTNINKINSEMKLLLVRAGRYIKP